MADEKISALTSAGALAGTETLPIVQGGVTKKTTVQDVANLKATPDLQQVTTAGATTSVGITVDNGLGESVDIKHDQIKITNASGEATITSPTLTTATEFRIPDKATSPQTFAMLEDVTALSFVPYTGATADVDLDNNGLDAKFVKIKGTAGNGHLNLKHQSSGATAGGSESVLYADNSGNPAWKNDGNAVETILTSTGGSLTGALNEAKGADIASAATTDIGAATGNYVVVTGTTTITALGTVQAGTRRIVKFSGILTLTHNATSLILPTAANITTAAGDTATFISLGSGNWVCTNYMRASGAALVGSLKDTILVSVMGTTISPLDNTSYHFGIQPWTPSTTPAFRAFKFTDAGTIEKFSFALSQTINGSNQTVTIYLRNVTTSTDNLIGTFTSDFGANTTLKTLITSLSISVNTTDDWTLKILTPIWGTNPTDWVFGGTLSLTKS